MRVIINFFIYGFIFFLIYLFFPEAFTTLVEWARKTYEFFAGLVQTVKDKTTGSSPANGDEAHKVVSYLFGFLNCRF